MIASMFLKEEKICFKVVYYFTFRLNHSSGIALESKSLRRRKSDFFKKELGKEGQPLDIH